MLQRIFEKFVRVVNQKTLYPMVVKPWCNVKTPGLLLSLMESGYFRSFLQPMEPNLEDVNSVLVIAPHQDDEAIGCGGLLSKLSGNCKITVLFVTDGEQFNLGISATESVCLRKDEVAHALELIDADYQFLDLSNNSLELSERTTQALKSSLLDLSPGVDLILAPWLFDRPFKHRICNAILLESLKSIPQLHRLPMWGYQVHNCLFPNVVVDVTNEMPTKLEMIRRYGSQIDRTPYDHFIAGMNQWNAQYLKENKRGHAEVFCALPVCEWLEIYSSIIQPRLQEYVAR